MHSFGSGVDGLEPAAGLLADKAGNFYGTTSYGGSYGTVQSAGLGTVFKIAPDGTEKVLHSFGNGTDGAVPAASLIAGQGRVTSTAPRWAGGAYAASSGGYGGTVFKIAPDGTETVLYSFTGGADGSIPSSSLLLDAADNLYGTAQRGGIGGSGGNGNGVVFKLAPNGTETVLYAFTGGSDGCLPSAT
ncbi:MAG: choice-of-anchor tandem repeat GloVer-containing protein [Rhodospirillales bacterium]